MPSEGGISGLLSGGAGLSALPVRATDDGKSFDSTLVDRLKPSAHRGMPKCQPLDPLCDP
ncbi:MAG: hypothetical protein IPM79_32595 [Polyangiaceae bacterium]|nr:hypothetical protein [Polyangiaceae bacterium]MBK8942219.1 hypothetical protein [Polyangiaceae bacterium]